MSAGTRRSDGPLGPDERPILRRALIEARDRTVAQVRALERDLEQIIESSELAPPDDEHDPEGATIAYERAQISALLRRAREDLAAVEEAWRRLAAGAAFRCERCGGPISTERLMALPTTKTCIGCASLGR